MLNPKRFIIVRKTARADILVVVVDISLVVVFDGSNDLILCCKYLPMLMYQLLRMMYEITIIIMAKHNSHKLLLWGHACPLMIYFIFVNERRIGDQTSPCSVGSYIR